MTETEYVEIIRYKLEKYEVKVFEDNAYTYIALLDGLPMVYKK